MKKGRRISHLKQLATLLITCLCGVSAVKGQGPVISEFLAANATLLKDGDEEFSDWIEIFNSSNQPVSLNGWGLTDDADSLFKWQFPAVSIPGQGFLVVFASGKDKTDPAGPLHTNFSLNRDGEFLALVRPDGSVSSQFSEGYPGQLADVSYGIQMQVAGQTLVASDATAALLVPEDDAVDTMWMLPGFDDSSWRSVVTGIGYDVAVPPEGELQFLDASQPGDAITATSLRSPAGEGVENVIDGQTSTKYLNFDTLDAGCTVTLSRGSTVLTGLRFTSANDRSERDPTSFTLSGSNDGNAFTEVARGSIPDFPARFFTVEVEFENETAFSHYRLIFPTVRNPGVAVAVQIAEIEFLALINVGAGELEMDVSQAGDSIAPTSFNSPVNEEVDKAIDDDPATKYLNFDRLNAGFTVTPSVGLSLVTGLRLTSANDAPNRDPTSYTLEGSMDGMDFAPIAAGDVPRFPGRFASVQVNFANTSSYLHYRLLFPTVRGADVAMQIAEVQFFGTSGASARTFGELFGTDVAPDLLDHSVGAYLRIPFDVADSDALEAPALRVWYNDGFIAYLNGNEVARGNAPAVSQWDALAVSSRSREEAISAERFDLSAFADLFVTGDNVLALHGFNDRIHSPEFLLRSELGDTQIAMGEVGYFSSPTPGSSNVGGASGIVSPPLASVERGFFEAPFMVSLITDTEDAAIRYTLDGSAPGTESGIEYSGAISIEGTTVLRAATFREGWLSSSITTQTYLFTSDVLNQTRASATAAGFPASWNSQGADYGLDSRVEVLPEELTSLPSISLVVEPDEMFGRSGIYANPTARGAAWERPVSFEWIDPLGNGDSFGEDAGIRIQGGAFRRFDLTLKKSFRLVFRERYGDSRLQRSIFGPSAAAQADSIVLRANGNDAWKWGGASTLYIRDSFAMESMRAMGNVASHSSFAHLYINGLYWGLYNPTERPDAAFSSTYHGGAKSSWDALNQDSVPDGNSDAWNRLLSALRGGSVDDATYQRVQGNDPDGKRNADIEVLLDVDNLIDYMMLNFYLGNADWPGRNHWYGINRDGEQGFQFYPWDSETAMGLNSSLTTNRIGVGDAVARPYAALRTNAEFRQRFGDRVHRHFFNGGTFYVDPSAPMMSQPALRFSALADRVEPAIAGESARWGDQLGSSLFTRSRHWQRERDDLLNNYFPRRSAIVLDQFRSAGLYPQIDAPLFNQHGGIVPSGFSLTMTTGDNAEIRYTLDGSDPLSPQTVEELSRLTVVSEASERRVLVPTFEVADDWRSDPAWDDSDWQAGSGAVGYDSGSDYDDLIDIDLEATMRGVNSSAFIRIPFDYDPVAGAPMNFMTLRARFDDGFVAYLNGSEIVSSNAPPAPAWDSVASSSRSDAVAVQWQDFDVSSALGSLGVGKNILAVHGLNVSTGSSDFLCDTELIIGERRVTAGASEAFTYSGPIMVTDLATVKARALSGGQWSALNEATFVVGSPRLVVSEFDYHPAPPSPMEIAEGFDDADDFEFIELYNPDALSVDLRGVRITDGVVFDFADTGQDRLRSGKRIVLVRNADAFTQRYGTVPSVAGEYSGQFSNSGERVEIVDANDAILVAFTYGDRAPWPNAADGGGASLEYRDASVAADLVSSWSTSGAAGPTPGLAPAGSAISGYMILRDRDEVVLTFLALEGQGYVLETNTDLKGDWQPLRQVDPLPNDDQVEIRIELNNEEPLRFFRFATPR